MGIGIGQAFSGFIQGQGLDQAIASAQQQSALSNQYNQLAPKEPNITERVRELVGYIGQLEDVQANIRARLIGPAPSAGASSDKDVACLEVEISDACTRLACLVGEARTILGKL